MKTKYIINGGLAFTEKKDINKLEKYATEGWVLKGFAFGGFFYKLVKGPKQEVSYAMDFQPNPDADYFNLFTSAGWHHIVSHGKHIHVFSAPKGTEPIYSANEVEEGKYEDITSSLGKGALYSLLALILFSLATVISKSFLVSLYYPMYVASLISLVAFIFCFMPYVKYKLAKK